MNALDASALPPVLPAPGLHGVLALRTWAADAPGENAPVLAIGGLDGASDLFAAVASALVGRRDLHGLDLRGRGAAETVGPYAVAAHADDVVAILDRIGWDPVVLIGHSYGANVAAEVARRRPDGVARLVLLDGGTPRQLGPDVDRSAVASVVAEGIVANLGTKPYPVAPDAVRDDCRSMFCDAEANEAVFDLEVPVTLIRAELGVAPQLPPVVPDAAVEELRAVGGNDAELVDVVVAGANHFSILLEPDTALVAALVEG